MGVRLAWRLAAALVAGGMGMGMGAAGAADGDFNLEYRVERAD